MRIGTFMYASFPNSADDVARMTTELCKDGSDGMAVCVEFSPGTHVLAAVESLRPAILAGQLTSAEVQIQLLMPGVPAGFASLDVEAIIMLGLVRRAISDPGMCRQCSPAIDRKRDLQPRRHACYRVQQYTGRYNYEGIKKPRNTKQHLHRAADVDGIRGAQDGFCSQCGRGKKRLLGSSCAKR